MSGVDKPLWKVCAEAALEAERDGHIDQAEQQYVWSVIHAQESYLSAPEHLGEALINIADFYTAHHRYSESKESYHRAREVYDTVFGTDNLVTAMIYQVLAEISLEQNQVKEARVLRARARNIFEERVAS